ncbi:Uncharacterised protein [Klebsiella pneumoniae]|nr:Uncharacterised protein [Klebsiella pneumoniae]
MVRRNRNIKQSCFIQYRLIDGESGQFPVCFQFQVMVTFAVIAAECGFTPGISVSSLFNTECGGKISGKQR